MIFLFLTAALALPPDSLETSVARKIAEAKTPAALETVTASAEELRVARLACRIQLRRAQVPDTCYRAIRLEKAFRLNQGDTLAQLDRRCEAAAKKMSRLTPVALRDLTPKCRAQVLKARELLAYKLDLL